jgi:hypothetical protein
LRHRTRRSLTREVKKILEKQRRERWLPSYG